MLTYFVFIISLFTVQVTASIKLNDLVTICHKHDTQCLITSSQTFLSKMTSGIRDFNIPPIDPLHIPFMELSQPNKIIGLNLNISNTIHKGMSKFQIKNITWDDKKNKVEISVNVPEYELNGICDIGGRILLLPIVGHGACNLASQYQFTFSFNTGNLKINGKEHLKGSNYKMVAKYSAGKFKMEGLFPNSPDLANTMHRFLNENALEVLNEMRPILQDVWGHLFGTFVDRILIAVPSNELFLD